MKKAETEMTDWVVHHPVVVPIVNDPVPRVPEETLRRLEECYLPDLSDAVGALYTMDRDIRPLYGGMRKLAGQALTVKLPPGDNLTLHGALGMVQPGDVLVVDWRGYVGACATGASSLRLPLLQGLRGVVVDGAWRDVRELEALDVPICGRGLSAFSPPKAQAGEINTAVACGGVVVFPGDFVVGDDEGTVVIPQHSIERVLEAVAPYQPPSAEPENWNLAAMERGMADRTRAFRQVVEAAGGIMASSPRSP